MKQLTDKIFFKNGAVINNRMVQSPMLTNSGNTGEVSQDTLNYWQVRNNSAGMMITEYHYVSENGGPALTWADNRTQLAVYDDKFLPGLTKLAKTMKANGNKAILQIAHTGREANYRAYLGLPVYGPSDADYPFLPYHVQGFTTEEVEQVVKDFGTATKRAIQAGFDGIEIHGANHYLIQQFFSRFSNKRTDRWGDPESFPLAVANEVFKAVTEFAPKNFIVGYRISPEEINPDSIGYTWHESAKLVKQLTGRYPFDYVHLSMSSYDAKPADSEQTFAQLFKPYLSDGTKLIVVGGIINRETATQAMHLADLVAVGKAQLIDANFAAKLLSGKDQEIITELTDELEKEQELTPGLREVFDKEEKIPNWGEKVFKEVDYDKSK